MSSGARTCFDRYGGVMATWTPNSTLYLSARMAMQAPAEKLAYMAILNVEGTQPDALGVVDLDPQSSKYGELINRIPMPNAGDELHHFGWNACSSALCPYAPHPHVERRYLIVPGLRSSRIHILDTKPDPRAPEIVKVIEPNDVHRRSGYSRPHTLHLRTGGHLCERARRAEWRGPWRPLHARSRCV
jgi:selenium-binding protein 1